MLDSLARAALSADQDGVGALGSTESKLVKGEALAAGGRDAGAGSLGEAEGADGELGNLDEADIVGDGSDEDGGLFLLALHEVCETRERQRRVVDAGHEQPLEDDLVELGTSSPGQEAVELVEERSDVARAERVRPPAKLHKFASQHF